MVNGKLAVDGAEVTGVLGGEVLTPRSPHRLTSNCALLPVGSYGDTPMRSSP